MKWLRLILIAGVALTGAMPVQATMRRITDLTFDERQQLQESEKRLAIYDQTVRWLDNQWTHHRVSRQDYLFKQRELNSFINAEATYQNELLVKTPTFPEASREVMQNIARYAVIGPAYILGYVLQNFRGSGTFPAH
jgi:hypothetical protein